MFLFKKKFIGVILMASAIGMFLVIILPKGILGLILAGLVFVIGLYLFKICY